MTKKEFKQLQESLVVVARGENGLSGILNEMTLRRNITFYIQPYLYDPADNRYRLIRRSSMAVIARIDQYLGAFSDDGRIEMFSAKVKDVCHGGSLPLLQEGARICVCYDAVAGSGSIRTIQSGGDEIKLELMGTLREYDFDGEPVEVLPDLSLEDALASFGENGQAAGDGGEAGNGGAKQPEKPQGENGSQEPEGDGQRPGEPQGNPGEGKGF